MTVEANRPGAVLRQVPAARVGSFVGPSGQKQRRQTLVAFAHLIPACHSRAFRVDGLQGMRFALATRNSANPLHFLLPETMGPNTNQSLWLWEKARSATCNKLRNGWRKIWGARCGTHRKICGHALFPYSLSCTVPLNTVGLSHTSRGALFGRVAHRTT